MPANSTSRWVEKKAPLPQVESLQKSLEIDRVFATILVNRDITGREQALSFFQPKLQNLHDPFLLNGMEKAVDRVVQAIEAGECIFLYGDYDVDGITSTSLLYKCLKLFDANVHYYIPDRKREGYGMNPRAIEHIHSKNAKLIITVDCGSRGYEAIEKARQLGIDVIVTDHHELGVQLPQAVAIVNPKDCRGHYPFSGIAGVGVAFKLAWALCLKFSPGTGKKVKPRLREFLMDAIGLVALGTVADVAPIKCENRSLVRHGLVQLEKASNPGIQALKEVSRLKNVTPLTPQHVGFRLGPLLNAMGRLEHASACVELLITEDQTRAGDLAKQLEQVNKRRKSVQYQMLQQARQELKERGFEQDKVLVLSGENWNPGVIGIVASNLLSEYYRPVCIIGMTNGTGKGSARSIPGFHLCNALEHCAKHLSAFGGHEMAAGFEITEEQIPHFREAINQYARELLSEEQMQPFIDIDAVVELDDVSWQLYYDIDKLAPFGEGNRYPVLASYQVDVVKNPPPQRCGSKGEHLKFWVKKGSTIFSTIAFSRGSLWEKLKNSEFCDIVFGLNKNEWGNNIRLELEVQDIRV